MKRYIAADVARRAGSRDLRTIVAPEKRVAWLESRKGAVLRDLKSLLRMIADRGGFQPYQGKFVPEADKFATITVANNWQEFSVFINKSNQTFCETIDKIHSPQMFFGQFKAECPELFYAFNRIRVFRNDVDHIILNGPVQTAFDRYIEADLLGRTLSQIQEPWFVLQQVVLDELFAALLFEINSRT